MKVNDVLTYADYRYWADHSYLRIRDTANRLGWYPQGDAYHHIADLAGCLRLEENRTNIYRISYDPLIGKSAIAGVDRLTPLTVPTRIVQNELWIPVDLVARTIGYTVSFSLKQQRIELDAPHKPLPMTLAHECQVFIKKFQHV